MNTVNLQTFQTVHGQSFANALHVLKAASGERLQGKKKTNAMLTRKLTQNATASSNALQKVMASTRVNRRSATE